MKPRGKRGGARPGSGRPRRDPPIVTRIVHITTVQAALLDRWGGGCCSKGLQWLINVAAPLVAEAVVTLKKNVEEKT